MRSSCFWASRTCFAELEWYDLHADVQYLVTAAGWKPWDTKPLTRRERKFWVAYWREKEERHAMSQVTESA